MSCMARRTPRAILSLCRRSHRSDCRRQSFSHSAGLNLKPRATHHDIHSFLDYAREIGLDNASTVYVGTLFEYTVQAALAKIQMKLTQTGGKGDLGVDLRGTWTPPTRINIPSRPLVVYVSCKTRRLRSMPQDFRELTGVLETASTKVDNIGILACTKQCSPGSIKHMLLSKKPLAYVCITPYAEGGYLRQCLWNNVAADILGHGLGVAAKYFPGDRKANVGVEGIREEVVLTLDGKIIDFNT